MTEYTLKSLMKELMKDLTPQQRFRLRVGFVFDDIYLWALNKKYKKEVEHGNKV